MVDMRQPSEFMKAKGIKFDYVIVKEQNSMVLGEDVTEKIEKGGVCLGGLVIASHRIDDIRIDDFCQAMLIPRDKS